MELINREDVRREIQYSFDLGAFAWRDGQYLMDRINALPTIEAVPVRHGEWIHLYKSNYRCSVCGSWFVFEDENNPYEDGRFCSYCGARMIGERREG